MNPDPDLDPHLPAPRRARGRLARRLTRRSVALALAVVAASAVLPASVDAAADAPTLAPVTNFSLVNGASFQADSRPRGAVLSMFTDAPVSDEAQTFPGVAATPAGVSVEVDNCTLGGPAKRLPILYVGPSGGGSQINVYLPNDVGPEPFGECSSPPFSTVVSTFTLHTSSGQTVAKRLTTNPVFPGIFVHSAPQPAHYNATTGVYTGLPQCAEDPARCPVATGSRANFLVVWTTGGELRSCNTSGFRGCDDPRAVKFRLTPVGVGGSGASTGADQTLTYYGPDGNGAQGLEQANIQLAPGTTAGAYRLAMRVPDLPDQSPLQQIPVTLGPAN